jgi:hypothetical protein
VNIPLVLDYQHWQPDFAPAVHTCCSWYELKSMISDEDSVETKWGSVRLSNRKQTISTIKSIGEKSGT